MISQYLLIYVLFAHLVGDFFIQSNKAATNKHHSWLALWEHVWTYSAVLFVAGVVVASPVQAMTFAAVNGAAHFVIDAITSRMTTYFWVKAIQEAAGKSPVLRNVFHVIGTDQFLHTALIILTLNALA